MEQTTLSEPLEQYNASELQAFLVARGVPLPRPATPSRLRSTIRRYLAEQERIPEATWHGTVVPPERMLPEITTKTLVNLPIDDIIHYCQQSKKIQQYCETSNLWSMKVASLSTESELLEALLEAIEYQVDPLVDLLLRRNQKTPFWKPRQLVDAVIIDYPSQRHFPEALPLQSYELLEFVIAEGDLHIFKTFLQIYDEYSKERLQAEPKPKRIYPRYPEDLQTIGRHLYALMRRCLAREECTQSEFFDLVVRLAKIYESEERFYRDIYRGFLDRLVWNEDRPGVWNFLDRLKGLDFGILSGDVAEEFFNRNLLEDFKVAWRTLPDHERITLIKSIPELDRPPYPFTRWMLEDLHQTGALDDNAYHATLDDLDQGYNYNVKNTVNLVVGGDEEVLG